MTHRTAVGLVAVALALCFAAPARAKDAAAAQALFDQGRAAMKDGNYDKACARFRESQRLDPEPGTMLNLANCEQKRGKLATAWQLYHGALDELPPDDERVPIAQSRADALEKRLPKLTVKLAAGAPAGTTVKRDDMKLEAGSLGAPLPVDPGDHTIIVKAPGHEPRTFHVQLAESESRTIAVQPGAAQAAGEVGTGGGKHAGSKTLGYVFGGIGVAGVVVGSITGVMALGKHSTVTDPAHCNQSSRLCDATGASAASSGRTLGAITTASYVVGAIGLGAGAYFLFVKDNKEQTQTGLLTSVTPAGPSVSLVHTW